ncbi:hypothetical protein [Mycoplasmopsis edwardii]|uniref:Uncharacterized protein n=1 Tax=Mycoplasmopsis edwardii TaxID=53558 RepID=A0ACD4PJD9_9BACT|nr:hypothetical protein [Mycoplasmopsis edwardii]WBP84318.1 hypothetical protein Me_995_000298 [Mycoplasmopsis edwardii]
MKSYKHIHFSLAVNFVLSILFMLWIFLSLRVSELYNSSFLYKTVLPVFLALLLINELFNLLIIKSDLKWYKRLLIMPYWLLKNKNQVKLNENKKVQKLFVFLSFLIGVTILITYLTLGLQTRDWEYLNLISAGLIPLVIWPISQLLFYKSIFNN